MLRRPGAGLKARDTRPNGHVLVENLHPFSNRPRPVARRRVRAMVRPNSRFHVIRAIVIDCGDDMKRVSDRAGLSGSRSQNASTLWRRAGLSTRPSTQIRRRVGEEPAKISASAVSACSPPDNSDSVCGFLPGGLAMNFEASSSDRRSPINAFGVANAARRSGENSPLEMSVDDFELRQERSRPAVEALIPWAQPL